MFSPILLQFFKGSEKCDSFKGSEKCDSFKGSEKYDSFKGSEKYDSFKGSDPKDLKNLSIGVYKNDEPLIVYKYVVCHIRVNDHNVAKAGICRMEIPKGSKIVVAENRKNHGAEKFRTNHAWTIEIYPLNKEYKYNPFLYAYSVYDRAYMYSFGKAQIPRHKFSKDTASSCRSGIHFFTSEEDVKTWASYNPLALDQLFIKSILV